MAESKNPMGKSFWQRPEGITGMIFLAPIVAGFVFLMTRVDWPAVFNNTLYLTAFLGTLGAVTFLALDPRVRNLIFYGYKSVMRWITGIFVKIDPISILKSYIEELQANLRKMSRQVNQLRAQMHQLKEIMVNNEREISTNLEMASQAKKDEKTNVMILKSRKAGRLQESNLRLDDLYKRMETLYRVLTKMHENSHILSEDIKDQVEVKEREQKAIHASNSAMKSAMSIITGDPDKRAMFDMAMEAVAEDVASKVGEMERFMDMSANFMKSIDLQEGIFEEEGLKMLEQWEKESDSLLLGEAKSDILNTVSSGTDTLDLNVPQPETVTRDPGHKNQYDSFFE